MCNCCAWLICKVEVPGPEGGLGGVELVKDPWDPV